MNPLAHRRRFQLILRGLLGVLALFVIGLAGCAKGSPTPTATPERPTLTPKPTFTAVPSPTERPSDTPTATKMPATATPTPTATADANVSPLTGLRVDDPAKLQRRVLAVRIGNDPEIRPQDGLGKADMVFEELMEGYVVTRYTALFLDSDAERIRPIRSARLSSLIIPLEYDAALVHSGASDEVRWRLSQSDVINLDEYYDSVPYSILAGYDWRGRMYTSTDRLHAYLKEKGLERDTPIKGYSFDTTPPQGDASASKIHVPYPRTCVVDWTYDATAGAYLRFAAGQPYMGGLTKEQIQAQNVIILYAEHRKTNIVEDSLGNTSIDIAFTGEGKALFCRDGVAINATWKLPDPHQPVAFYDAQGNPISFKPGHTWIEIVPTDYDVTMQ